MNKTRIMFSVLLGAFGLLVGLPTTSAFGVEKGTTTNVKKVTKIDVNNATNQELQTLPGIGEAHAQKIINGRPYKSEADLVKTGLSQSTIDKIKGEIRFGRVKRAKPHMKTDSKSASTSSPKSKNNTYDETPKIPPRKGMVWVNKETMVYHTEGDRWYGNTKNGEFMNENDAIKLGAHRSKQD